MSVEYTPTLKTRRQRMGSKVKDIKRRGASRGNEAFLDTCS